VWAVEGARGVGAGLAQRLVAEGEPVLDVPARLSARVRALGGGSGRKTDDADAFAVAVAGLRARELQVVRPDDTTEIMRLLTVRRQEVVEARIATVNRLHVVLCQLILGGAKRHLSVTKARPMLSAMRPRDAVGKARKQLALDYLGELERLDARLKELKQSLAEVLAEHPTTLLEINGVGPINAAKILAEVGDVRRFPSRHHFASYTGTAPVDVSSGENNRHRLNRLRQPPAQPRHAHSRRRPGAYARARSGLLPAKARGRQDPPRSAALPQATHLRRRLSRPRRRPGSSEPGRTSGGVSSIQRG
jgi:transposase